MRVYDQIRTLIGSLDLNPMSLYYGMHDGIFDACNHLINMIYKGTILVLVLKYI